MRELEKQVAGWIAAHRMLDPGSRVAVAVSGGADSTALLFLLHELAPAHGWQLAVAHYDHRWRADSAADAAAVAALAGELGLEFRLARSPEPVAAANREQSARRLRYAFFQELIARGGVDRVATAHTADDQAETVLLRILRGAGPGGLAGILPVRPIAAGGETAVLIRPLLASSRADVRAWLVAHGRGWREDSTNRDLRGRRNRLRIEIMPLLRAGFNPRIEASLAALAEVARAEEVHWASIVGRLTEHLWQPHRQGLAAPRDRFQALGLALRRRLLREGVRRLQGDLLNLSFEAVEAVLKALDHPARHPRRFPLASLVCRVTSGRIELSRATIGR